MADVVLVDIQRIPFSKSRPQEPEKDAYNNARMDEAAALCIKKLVERNRFDTAEIGDVISGCALQQKEQYMMGGRMPSLLAGLPMNVSAQAIERVCCSGMSAIHQCAMEIALGYSDICIAGGMEHMTHVPLDGRFNKDVTMASPNLFEDPYLKPYNLAVNMLMGNTAENVFNITNCTREDMDRWSVDAHLKAAKAIDEGYYKDEMIPMTVEQADGTMLTIENDLCVRPDANYETFAALRPCFQKEGSVTAASSSPLNAGACYVLLMSEEKAKSLGLKPLAKIIGMGWCGVEPGLMGVGPVPAAEIALKHAGLNADEIDYWEVNEAFAIVALYAIEKLNLDPATVNVKGGGVAIGHPLSASGPRITGTLGRILQEKNAKYGVATMCGGGGQGTAVVLEKM